MTEPPRPTVAVAAVVFDRAGRLLLVERGRPPGVGQWTVPGGKLEAGESLAEGVAREVLEETGVTVEVGPLVCAIERRGPDYHYVILDYLAHPRDPEAARAGDDARAARFVADDELASLPLTDGLVEVVAQARAIAVANAADPR